MHDRAGQKRLQRKTNPPLMRRMAGPVEQSSQSRPCAARVMKSATASGLDSMMTWLEWTVVVSALIVCAIMASSLGEMTRSSLATIYHDGFVRQAGAVAGVPNATSAIGP